MHQKPVQGFVLGRVTLVVVQYPQQLQDLDKLSVDVSILSTQSTRKLGRPHCLIP